MTSRSGVILADIPYIGHFGALVSSTNTKSSELMMGSALPMNNVNSIQATATVQVHVVDTNFVNPTCISAQASTSWTNITLPDTLAAAQRYPVCD